MPPRPAKFNGTPVNKNWVQLLLRFFRLPFVFGAGIASLVLFFFGSLLFQCIAFMDFATTPAIWFTCFGTGWVLGSVYWGLRELPIQLANLKGCIVSPCYGEMTIRWMRYFSSNVMTTVCALALLLFGGRLLYRGLFYSFPADLRCVTAMHHILTPPWYHCNLVYLFVLLLVWGFPACFAGGAGVSLFVVNIPFMYKISKLEFLPLPSVLLAKFRVMSDFYLKSTLSWFVGVGVSVMFFSPSISVAAVLFIAITSLIGLTAIMVPQFIFHGRIVRAQSDASDAIIKRFHSLRGERNWKNHNDALRELNRVVESPTWVYRSGQIVGLVASNFVIPGIWWLLKLATHSS